MTDNEKESRSTTHQELTLALNADVAEWCPLPASTHRRLLAAGTYQLNETTQEREGRLYIYKLEGKIKKDGKLSLQCATTYNLPGIFDLKWLPEIFSSSIFSDENQQQARIVAALADGSLSLLTVLHTDKEETDGAEVIEVSKVESPEGGMALSLDCRYINNDHSSTENLISSYSDGILATNKVHKRCSHTLTV
jgi:hypothetical protein